MPSIITETGLSGSLIPPRRGVQNLLFCPEYANRKLSLWLRMRTQVREGCGPGETQGEHLEPNSTDFPDESCSTMYLISRIPYHIWVRGKELHVLCGESILYLFCFWLRLLLLPSWELFPGETCRSRALLSCPLSLPPPWRPPVIVL